jgi:hypothetical protein
MLLPIKVVSDKHIHNSSHIFGTTCKTNLTLEEIQFSAMGIQRSSITSTTDFINLDTEFLPQVIEKLSHNGSA